jgi:hypothetical protein
MVLRIIDGKEKRFLLDAAGGCETCGFCEPGLIAWQEDGSDAVISCEECLENLRPSDSPRFSTVYLPELDISSVSHYVRVSAFFAFATKTYGHAVYADNDALMPYSFATPSAWKAPLKYRSKSELDGDQKVPQARIRAATQAVLAYEFMLERVETARSLFGSASASEIISKVGEGKFRSSCRVIPLSIPVSRIRSWGHHESSFMTLGFGSEPPTARQREIADKLQLDLDDVFDDHDEFVARGN